MTILTVCPVIIPPRPGLLDSWDHQPHMVVINGEHDLWLDLCHRHQWMPVVHDDHRNIGCPASWNFGFTIAETYGFDYVTILSQSFVPTRGLDDLTRRIEADADHRGARTNHMLFHCATFSVATWKEIGGFDESLPIWCDIDFIRRGYLAGVFGPDRRLPVLSVDALDERCAAVYAGAISSAVYDEDELRYAQKWCGPLGHEADRPTPLGPDGGIVA